MTAVQTSPKWVMSLALENRHDPVKPTQLEFFDSAWASADAK
jgi:hypothetical protein